NWKFADVTRSSGLSPLEQLDAGGICLADLEGDGDLDLLVNTFGAGTWIFTNDGRGQFARTGVLNPNRCGSSAALADMDGDGDLDLYIANYRINTVRDDPEARYRMAQEDGKTRIVEYNGRSTESPELKGRFSVQGKGRVRENGEPDALFRNDGAKGFVEVPFTGGTFLDESGRPLTEPLYDWGLSVLFRDLNGDRLPDLYVCNDFESPDRIWWNQGNGTFKAAPSSALRQISMFSMGIDVADVNRDGRDDFFVVDMLGRTPRGRHVQIGGVPPYELPPGGGEERLQFAYNTLFMSRGDGTFAQIAWAAGVEASDWSWTPVFLDMDLDGFEDLLITTGHERDAMNADVMERADTLIAGKKRSRMELLRLNAMFVRLNSPNVSFRNRGDTSFEDVSDRWGFNSAEVSHGMCLADLDEDGDMDVLVNNLNGEAGVYRNNSSAPRVAVRLKGKSGNTAGAGARITLRDPRLPVQSQEIMLGGRYLSSDQSQRTFAAAPGGSERTLEVRWRTGKTMRLTGVLENSLYELDESQAESVPESPIPARVEPWFEDVSTRLGHVHVDEPFNEMQRQPLLPWHLGRLGPGVCWMDADADGWMDLAIGSGRGGSLGVFRNDHKGHFQRLTNGSLSRLLARDNTGLVAMPGMLVVGSANYEDGTTNGGSIRIYDVIRGGGGESLLGPQASTGPLAMADIDGDGDLDLFVGGRVIAGRYPQSPVSTWYRNESGRFRTGERFADLGMVSGAVLTDLDGDGDPDAVLACDWGPLRILRNQKGKLEHWTPEVIHAKTGQRMAVGSLQGWWRGVATGDLDGDGRLDIVASNQGINTRHQASKQSPWVLYHGDMMGIGAVELVEAKLIQGREVPQRTWRMVRSALPFLAERVAGYEAYAQASVQEIYAERLATMQRLEVNTVSTVLLLNRGDVFEMRELPAEVQWAPACGISIADFDGNGTEDVFLTQNHFTTNLEFARCDAGRGLLLTNDAAGTLVGVPGNLSGLVAYGDQRGCAVADFDLDGRTDLVLGQNNGPTHLFKNRSAQPGLIIRLVGQASNPSAVGASIRLVYGERRGHEKSSPDPGIGRRVPPPPSWDGPRNLRKSGSAGPEARRP
ncbi:MAG: hypothetical protein FJ405_09590, partial [Verrucomicrobia bacterium]|nr:hypothetical protein [Verrucomicrobiota bacterium]